MSDWIDLTRTLENGMIHWPGDPPFQWRRVAEITGPGTCNLSEIQTCVHIGTHIDAPLHFIAGGGDVASLPLSKLCGPAIVVDVPEPRDVRVGDLERAGIRPGERVLLRTLNRDLWAKGIFDEGFFAIDGDAARWLADHDVPTVGVDYLSVDGFHHREKSAHYALLGAGVVIIEGIDLARIRPGRYEMVALPLKIAGSDGSPARVIIRPVRE